MVWVAFIKNQKWKKKICKLGKHDNRISILQIEPERKNKKEH